MSDSTIRGASGPHEQGATAAAPIFRDFMEQALKNSPPTPFRVPPGIDFATVNRLTGAAAPAGAPGTILEAFKAGTEPSLASLDPAQKQQKKKPATTVGQGTGGLY